VASWSIVIQNYKRTDRVNLGRVHDRLDRPKADHVGSPLETVFDLATFNHSSFLISSALEYILPLHVIHFTPMFAKPRSNIRWNFEQSYVFRILIYRKQGLSFVSDLT